MNKFLVSSFILIQCTFLSAQNDSLLIQPFSLKVALGVGNKSHLGNFGVTSNFYFSSFLSLKGSLGVAPFNYSGGVASIGTEAVLFNWKKSNLSFGTMWTYIGKGFDLIGDDDSYDHFSYHTSSMQHLKFYSAYSMLVKNGFILTFEAGYCYAITEPNYTFGGPSEPTAKDIQRIDRALNSGWMATVSLGGFIRKKH